MGTDDPVSANLASAFKVATSSCLNLCKASSAAIFDLRTFRSAPTQRAKMNFARRRSTLTGDAEDAESQQRADAFGKGSGTIYLLGGTGDVDWMAITARQRELGDAVCASLDAFKAVGLFFAFDETLTDFDLTAAWSYAIRRIDSSMPDGPSHHCRHVRPRRGPHLRRRRDSSVASSLDVFRATWCLRTCSLLLMKRLRRRLTHSLSNHAGEVRQQVCQQHRINPHERFAS